ncbi:hypothetical protein L9G15_05090 [Shewanella sp. A3A]|nr:hypothetical protein [Shewanella ferrihydritica]
MNLEDGYVACICEGSAEQAIMELLLEHDSLIFDSDNLLEGEIIRSRSAKEFENRYLKKGFNRKITILRILDSRKENFNLSKQYQEKISVINVITAPEIEMLIIVAENKYRDYNKSRLKPSDYCKLILGMRNVKRYDFVREYFSDVKKLVGSILEYRRVKNIPNGEYALFNLLKNKS